jgi:replicative DNA helicase
MPAKRATAAAVTPLRIPPHSIEAEQSVLGGLMLDNAAWDIVADRVIEGDFYHREHQLVFRAIAGLADRNSPFDVITLGEWLETNRHLDAVGGHSYLATLCRDTPSAANIRAYADIVRERAVLRHLVAAGHEIADLGFSPDGRAVPDLLGLAEQRVFGIADQYRQAGGLQPLKPLLIDAVDRLDRRFNNPATLVSTGWADLDRYVSTWEPGQLLIVAARPSMGKTAFALNCAAHMAAQGRPVAFFSLEMTAGEIVARLVAQVGRIDQTVLRAGNLQEGDWPKLTSAVSVAGELPLWIDESAGLTPLELAARARRLQHEVQQPLGMLVVDYLQLLHQPGKESRQEEVASISRALKGLAKELKVPVMALSQLNRKLEERADKRPALGDLRESGAIEADADVVLTLYRDEFYNPASADKGIAEIGIVKQRNGPTGIVKLVFLAAIGRFESYAQ